LRQIRLCVKKIGRASPAIGNPRVVAVAKKLREGAGPREIGPILTAAPASPRNDFEVSAPARRFVRDCAARVRHNHAQ
jgi:hypothetical protein